MTGLSQCGFTDGTAARQVVVLVLPLQGHPQHPCCSAIVSTIARHRVDPQTNPDWNEAESEVKLASNSNTQQLWEEDWDHDDAEDDFSAQLKEELSKTR